MNTYSKKLDLSKYTNKDSDSYIGMINTTLLLKKSMDSLSIDLCTDFCFINELINKENLLIVVITATERSFIDEVLFWFDKYVKESLEYSCKNFDFYSLSA